ncbi:MAG TPA: hypothetical protein VMV95_01000 [Bacillota bacterium]|nr:hypothetical protein [Bacillota bacterium]
MKLKTLLEDWKDSVKIGKNTYEIFKNPTPKELLSVSMQTKKEAMGYVDKDIRFIVDTVNHDIYVFSALLLHQDASERLGMEEDDDCIFDYGTYKKGKIEIGENFYLEGGKEYYTKIMKGLERYFSLNKQK